MTRCPTCGRWNGKDACFCEACGAMLDASRDANHTGSSTPAGIIRMVIGALGLRWRSALSTLLQHCHRMRDWQCRQRFRGCLFTHPSVPARRHHDLGVALLHDTFGRSAPWSERVTEQRRYRRAVHHLRRAIALGKDDCQALDGLGRALYSLAHWGGSVKVVTEVATVDIDTGETGVRRLKVPALGVGHLRDSAAAYGRAAAACTCASPDWHLFCAGRAMHEAGDPEAALGWFTQASDNLDASFQLASYLLCIADCLAELGRDDEAASARAEAESIKAEVREAYQPAATWGPSRPMGPTEEELGPWRQESDPDCVAILGLLEADGPGLLGPIFFDKAKRRAVVNRAYGCVVLPSHFTKGRRSWRPASPPAGIASPPASPPAAPNSRPKRSSSG